MPGEYKRPGVEVTKQLLSISMLTLPYPFPLSAPSENSAPPPDVTAMAPSSRSSRVDLPSNAAVQGMSRGQSRSSMMETADGKDSIT